MTLRHSWSTAACLACPIKRQCTPSKERRITRWEHEHIIDEVQQRLRSFRHTCSWFLAAACAQLGQTEAAKDALAKYERIRPQGHDAATMMKYHVRMCAKLEDRDRWLEGYRKIGFDV